MLGPIPECSVLQYFQVHKSYQNVWSFSISRFTSHTRMLGPSVFPDSQVIPECLVLQYFQIHGSYQNSWSSDAQSISSDTQNKRYKFRHPKYKFRHPKYSGISSDTQSISSKYSDFDLDRGKSGRQFENSKC